MINVTRELNMLNNLNVLEKFTIVNNEAFVSRNVLFRSIDNMFTQQANRKRTLVHFTNVVQSVQDNVFEAFGILTSPYVAHNYRIFNTMCNKNITYLTNMRSLYPVLASSLKGLDVLCVTYADDIAYCEEIKKLDHKLTNTLKMTLNILNDFL